MFKPLSLACTFCSICLLNQSFAQTDPLKPTEIHFSSPLEKRLQQHKPPVVKAALTPFTGKITAQKVRMRLQPDTNAHIVSELNKNEYVSVIDQEGDFYCVAPPNGLKAYVFRSFVIDNIVEGSRVNVRLEPDLESPIIGHLNSGDRVEGEISSINKKWLEIAPPTNTRFYLAKEFVEFVGGPELKAKMDKRKDTVAQLLESAISLAKSEMVKDFEEINFEQIKQTFATLLQDYQDFHKETEKAKEFFTQVQENYLQKRIEFLERKANLISSSERVSSPVENAAISNVYTWKSIEDALYANWSQLNGQKEQDAYYEEQKMAATTIVGVIEPYTIAVKNKPGDFVIKDKNLPVAYIYSTKVNLQDYIGKKVTLIASPRFNNNFAFPAYYVHEVN